MEVEVEVGAANRSGRYYRKRERCREETGEAERERRNESENRASPPETEILPRLKEGGVM